MTQTAKSDHDTARSPGYAGGYYFQTQTKHIGAQINPPKVKPQPVPDVK